MLTALPLVRYYDEYIADSEPAGSSRSIPNSPRKLRKEGRMASVVASAIRGPSPQSPSKHITVVDVYDLAASIGKDFERIIDEHGHECIRGIMPKVISALETLEALANNNERENEEVIALQKAVTRLESEKHTKKLENRKFEEEIEQIEEAYRKDIHELQEAVKSLTTENRTLSSTVSSMPIPEMMTTSQHVREEDVKAMLELRDMSIKQKEEIKTLQRDVETYSCEVENLQNAIEKLIRQNEELLRKNHSLQKQGRQIVEEKMEIIRRLEKTEENNIYLRKMLTDTDRVCKDLQQTTVADNEPRFTLAELREVLQEKNLLKGRVMELEEELEGLRPGGRKEPERLDATPSPQPPSADDELPVYGPMPREPDEKLFPWKYERKDSGVRKFFRFFKDFGASSSPRRGSGSVTNSPRPSRTSTHSQLSAI